MLKPYELLESVLTQIELNIKEGINVDELADNFSLSSAHLRRLFRFAFKQPISKYIRSRRLSASLEELLNSDFSVLDIALDYGFEFEQSYIRAFKKEFGITPGSFRRNEKIIKITPPLHLFEWSKLNEGALTGPEFVIVPKFHIIGKLHQISWKDLSTKAQETGVHFWEKERFSIKRIVEPDVYIGLTRNLNWDNHCSEYLPSVQVENLKNIPKGFCGETFDTSLCVTFRYIGQHHYMEINGDRATSMYDEIEKFFNDERAGYTHIHNTCNPNNTNQRINHFERIDTSLYDGTYCLMEWFAPIREKNVK